VAHFTHVDHLPTVVTDGLLSDSRAHSSGLLTVEVGNTDVKARRRSRQVPLPPGGVVADYVPFYFAPRSPMMFAIEKGNVATYRRGCADLVYLITDVGRLRELCPDVLATDRNAALQFAEFTADDDRLTEMVDWSLMCADYWFDTDDEPDRRERRMAECLVHDVVPWEAFTGVACKSPACATTARAALATVGATTPVCVRPRWYF
jgi:hypothetical protein